MNSMSYKKIYKGKGQAKLKSNMESAGNTEPLIIHLQNQPGIRYEVAYHKHQAAEIMGKRMTSNTFHKYISIPTTEIEMRDFFVVSLGVATLVILWHLLASFI